MRTSNPNNPDNPDNPDNPNNSDDPDNPDNHNNPDNLLVRVMPKKHKDKPEDQEVEGADSD